MAQGLRPFRKQDVRVERELRLHGSPVTSLAGTVPSRIAHTYGQGGAGGSLSFGCAGDVMALFEEALCDLPPRAVSIEAVATEAPRTFNEGTSHPGRLQLAPEPMPRL